MVNSHDSTKTSGVDTCEQNTVFAVTAESRPGSLSIKEGWGRYESLKFIGQGGMGAVYRAHDTQLNRNVALKFLREESPSMVQRFLTEARLQAKVLHENICKIYDVGEFDGHPYIAMQYIDGRTLKDVSPQLTLTEKVEILHQLAEALQSAHDENLIHRDIKPANIMVERNEAGKWLPYITDFGLAKDVCSDDHTMTGIVMGTIAYMSPEQANGENRRLDRRTDIYSLGAMGYELLTGQQPITGSNNAEIIGNIFNQEPLSLQKHDPEIPIDLETVILKCLQKNPYSRYNSARELADDLARYLNDEPVLARPISWTERIVRTARRNKALTIAVSLAVLVAVTILLSVLNERGWERGAVYADYIFKQTERTTALMRAAYMSPPHNIKSGTEQMYEHIDYVQKKTDREKRGRHNSFALGQMYLAIQDFDNARKHLQMDVKRHGKILDNVLMLGYANAMLYQLKLDEAVKIVNREERAARIKELETTFRDTAVPLLLESRQLDADIKAGQDAMGILPPVYIEALAAFLQGDRKLALEKAETTRKFSPWCYEAVVLTAEIYKSMARERRDAQNYQEAAKHYQLCEDAYRAALKLAPSDPLVYQQLARLLVEIIEMPAQEARPIADRLAKVCTTALIVVPENGEFKRLLAEAQQLLNHRDTEKTN